VSTRVAELYAEAGLPDGVFNVVHGDKVAVDAVLDAVEVANADILLVDESTAANAPPGMRTVTVPADLVERLVARLGPVEVAARRRERFVSRRRPVLGDQLGQLRALDGLDLETALERRSTVIADLAAGAIEPRF